jgi:hypothetical protein
MIVLFLLALYDGQLTPENLVELQRNRMQYPTLAELHDSMRAIALDFPSIVKLDSIGESYEGRQILYLEISDQPGLDEGEPGLFFIGVHHANEWTSLVVPLFFADSLASAYGQDSIITWIVDNCRIWIMPCFNVDGYYFSHDQNNTGWRKNRRPYGGSIGIDPNRNYYGGCTGNAHDTWGGQPHPNTSNRPSNMFFCGPSAFSEYENQALLDFVDSRRINVCISYHCYGESVSRPWAWSTNPAPDDVLLTILCDTIANMIIRESGSGHYTSFQQSSWYQICGSMGDFLYGYSRYVRGIPCYPFTIELGTSLAPDTTHLPQICRENFKALIYVAGCMDSVVSVTPRIVVAPDIEYQQSGNDYTVYWIPRTDVSVNFWRLWEMTGMSAVTDTFGTSNARWDFSGFSPTTQQAHSGTYSILSNYLDGTISHAATNYPYFVEAGDTVSFWTFYDLESDGDVAFFEISTDGLVWNQIYRLTGHQPFWHKLSYALEDFAGSSLYFRFRLSTDGNDRFEGIYIDDFYPTVYYDSVRLMPPISDTFYTFTNVLPGSYFYSAQGYNNQGAGIRSQLIGIDVPSAIAGADTVVPSTRYILPTISRKFHPADMPGSKIYNILGQTIRDIRKAGVYFIETDHEITKIIIID